MFLHPSARRLFMVVLLAVCQVALSLTAAIHHDHEQVSTIASPLGTLAGWTSDTIKDGNNHEYLGNAICRLCSWNRTVYRPATASQIRAAAPAGEARPATISTRPSRSATARHVLLRAPPLS